MQKYVRLMLRLELLGVTGLAVGYIGIAGLRIIDDLRPQDGNLRHAGFRHFDPVSQIVVFCGNGVSPLGQSCIIHEVMVLQISYGLSHLPQIELLGPIDIALTFS